MNHVVCVKWGNKYPSIYVNVLKNMVARHTSVTYQFTCLTDDPNGIDEDVNIMNRKFYIIKRYSNLSKFVL